MKRLVLPTVAVVSLSLFSCSPWDQMANWKKCAIVSISGNDVIGKTENTKTRESKSTIASVKNIVKDQGGKALNHSLVPDIEACAAKLNEKLAGVSVIPLIKSEEVLSNAAYAEMESDVDAKAKTDVGKNMQKATENWSTRPVPATGYKVLNIDQMTKLAEALGVDGQLAISINFMYDLQGVGTLGSAKGVAEVTFTAFEKTEKGIGTYTTSFTGESDEKCDVKAGGFFKGEDMDPLLINAFEKAVDEFIAAAEKNLAKAKAKAKPAA